MKIKILIFSILLILFTFFTPILINSQCKSNEKEMISEMNDDGNTYELVYEDGVWWIYVYSPDGVLIDKIPLDE